MQVKDTKDTYGIISKALHWPTAFIILALILVGFYMGSMPNSPEKFEIYALHKSFGILVLWLAGLRILWRLFTKQPDPQENHKVWERILAKLAHILLYVAMIGMPLSGWLMSSAGEYPVPFFGMQMPDLVGKDPELARLMHEVHEVLGFVLIGVVLLHALGAFKHHFIDEDSTLIRMMAAPMRHLGPYLLIIVLGLFGFGVVKLGFIDKARQKESQAAEEIKMEQDQTSNAEQYPKNSWNIVEDLSSLTFESNIYGKKFTGTFRKFDGDIVFDPNDLKNSNADISIDVKTIDSGDVERDSQMLGQEWFDIAEYSTARFKTIDFQSMGEGRYIAVGELTIKNRSMPVSLPFQLDIIQNDQGQKAYMTGNITLNRLDFGLGEERWKASDIVGLDVVVQVKLVAISNS